MKQRRRSGPINHAISQRSLWHKVTIHNGPHGKWEQHNPCGVNEQDVRRNDMHLPSTCWLTVFCRNRTQAKCSWQQMLQQFQRVHQDQQQDIPTRPTPSPLMEQGWKGNLNVQGQFCGNSLWYRHIISSKPLGPTVTPSWAYSQHGRPSWMTPTVSAYTYLWGQHDYNAHPFAPFGCKVESHLVPGIRETWAPHTASGYYAGMSWEHYRCHEVYII